MSDLPAEIEVEAVHQLQQDGANFLLLDVREQNEYDFAKIEGSRLLPMSELTDRIGELDDFKDKHIIVHCHHGGRSLHVTHALREQGFSQVQSMAGGIGGWSEKIDPTVPTY